MPLGSIAAPTITPLRAPSASKPSFHIDSGTYIEIETSNDYLFELYWIFIDHTIYI